MKIKNLKKLQLWSMSKFVQCIDECYGKVLNMDAECFSFLNENELFKFRKHEANKVLVTYEVEEPSFQYRYIKLHSLVEVNTMSQKLNIINLFFEATHFAQDVPIIDSVAGNEIYDKIIELARDIQDEEPINGF